MEASAEAAAMGIQVTPYVIADQTPPVALYALHMTYGFDVPVVTNPVIGVYWEVLHTVCEGEVIVALARVGAGSEQYVAIAVQYFGKNLRIPCWIIRVHI